MAKVSDSVVKRLEKRADELVGDDGDELTVVVVYVAEDGTREEAGRWVGKPRGPWARPGKLPEEVAIRWPEDE